MKTKFLLFLIILSSLISCSDDERTDLISAELELETDIPYIVYENSADLELQLTKAFPIPTGTNIPSNAIERVYEVNNDSTNVKVSFKIKDEFTNQYSLGNSSNSFLIIDILTLPQALINSAFIQYNFGATYDQIRGLENSLCNQLPNFDFDNAPVICFPITFHILNDVVTSNEINNLINNLNTNFSNAKIEFELSSINSLSTSNTQNSNMLNPDLINELPKSTNTLNVYVSKYIGNNVGIDRFTSGIAPFPTSINKGVCFLTSKTFDSIFDDDNVIATHEFGHVFSLYHTFAENEGSYDNNQCSTQDNCFSSSDGICETPLSPFSNNLLGLLDAISCSGSSSDAEVIIRNYMSYSYANPLLRSCNRLFVDEQNVRMRYAAEKWLNDKTCSSSPVSQSLSFYEYQGIVFETPSAFSNPTFSHNGLHMYSIADGKIVHYDLSNKYNLENLITPQELETIANGSTRIAKDVIISSDGATLFAKVKYVTFGSDLLLQYNLPSPYSLENAELVSQTEVFYAYNYFNISIDDETLYLMTNSKPNQGIKIIGYRFATPNDISTISANNEYSSPWIGYSNSFLPYVISKDGNSVLRSPVVGNSRILERYEVSEPWKLSTMNSNVESQLSHSFSDNGVIEFYDEDEQVIFISTNEQGVYRLHKYER